jgi:hypothetical protein
MSEAAAAPAAWLTRHEGWVVVLAGTLALVAIPLSLGYMGLSWDAVNHHIYLGWTAEHARFDRDYLPAAYQSYQFPYPYWPVYKLALAGASGATAGVVLALVHATALPAVWLIAKYCIPGKDLFAVGMRAAGVLLAFMSGLVLSMFDTTANDLIAAIPLLWAYALALRPAASEASGALRAAALSGALAGVAVAFKLSNGFLVLALPVLWAWPAGGLSQRALRCVVGGLFVVAGFAVLYGYWGWQLWVHFGNPVYPLYDGWFAPARDALGWHR